MEGSSLLQLSDASGDAGLELLFSICGSPPLEGSNDPFTGVAKGHLKASIDLHYISQKQNYSYELARKLILWLEESPHVRNCI